MRAPSRVVGLPCIEVDPLLFHQCINLRETSPKDASWGRGEGEREGLGEGEGEGKGEGEGMDFKAILITAAGASGMIEG